MMLDGLEPSIEIERQQRAGEQVAMAEGEIAPYRRPFDDTGYDAFSITRVIDTLRDKSWSAFKPSQFEQGPTFALAVADRLIVPGGKSSVVPFYYDEHFGSGDCESGVLWQMAFGTVGTPVLRRPEFEGKPSLEGLLKHPGLYVDESRLFPGEGYVMLNNTSSGRVSYGLKAAKKEAVYWSSDDSARRSA